MKLATPLIGLLMLSALASPVHAESARTVLASCEALLRDVMLDGSRVGLPPHGLPCWYYLAAVQDLSVLTERQSDEQPLLKVWCLA